MNGNEPYQVFICFVHLQHLNIFGRYRGEGLGEPYSNKKYK